MQERGTRTAHYGPWLVGLGADAVAAELAGQDLAEAVSA